MREGENFWVSVRKSCPLSDDIGTGQALVPETIVSIKI